MKRPLRLIAGVVATSLVLSRGGSEARLYEEVQTTLADPLPQHTSPPQHHQQRQIPSATIDPDDEAQARSNVDDQHRSLQTANAQGPWPECVGLTGMECKAIIEAANPEMTVHVSHPQKFNYYRVWVHIDEQGVVVGKPARG